MEVVGVQLDIAWEEKEANFAAVRRLLDADPPRPGALLVLPEMFASGFSMEPDKIAEDRKGPTSEFLARLSSSFRCTTVAGIVTAGPNGLGRNQAIVFDDRGEEIALYTKMHPFSPGGEDRHYERGKMPVHFSWNGVSVSPFICYDLRFP